MCPGGLSVREDQIAGMKDSGAKRDGQIKGELE